MTEVSNAVLADAMGEIEPQSIAERVVLRLAAARLRDTPSVSDSAGWIKWGGGDCPVPGETHVCYRLRNRHFPQLGPVRAEYLTWEHFGTGSDIVAYRLSV